MMRTQIVAATIGILFAATGFTGCKKDDKAAKNDIVLKNTIWTGESNYTGKAAEPISIAFGDNATFTWHELSGDYNGSWTLEDGLLKLSIDGALSFKANISDDKTLINIQNSDMSGRTLNNATLNESNDVTMDNTTWTAPNVKLTFKPGLKLDILLGPSKTYTDLSYVRKSKSIRFAINPSYKWFLTTNTSSSMKGANMFAPDPTLYAFIATKQ